MEFPEEVSHDGDHGFLTGHGDPFAVVVFTVQAFSSYQWQHDLAEDLPQQGSSLFGDPVLSSVDAGLSHANVETGVAQQTAPTGEVTQWPGFADETCQILGVDDPRRRLRDGRIDLTKLLEHYNKTIPEIDLTLFVEEEFLPQLPHLELEEVGVLGRMLVTSRGAGIVP